MATNDEHKNDEEVGEPISIPEPSPESNEASKNTISTQPRRRLWMGVGLAVLLVVVIVCIAVPLAGRQQPATTTTTSTLANTNEKENTVGSSTTTTMNSGDKFRISGRGVDEPENGAGKAMSMMNGTLPPYDGSNNMDIMSQLPLFDKDILQGYASIAELDRALEQAVLWIAMQTIASNVANYQNLYGVPKPYYQNSDYTANGDAGSAINAPSSAGAEPGAPPPEADTSAQGDSSVAQDEAGVTDYGTNNQEQRVDEADLIKADANFVYAAYGDYLLVWDTQGNKVDQVAMPAIPGIDNQQQQQQQQQQYPEEPMASTGAQASKSKSMPIYMEPQPKPRIESMMLTDSHLVAVVSGYGPTRYPYYYLHENMAMNETYVLSDYKGAQIRLYEKLDGGKLAFVGQQDVNGYFMDARSMGDKVYIATTSSVDLWTLLRSPLDPWNIQQPQQQQGGTNGSTADGQQGLLTADMYEELATVKARNQVVPAFVQKLRQEITMNGQLVPSMLQINQWKTQLENVTDNAQSDTTGATGDNSGADAMWTMPPWQQTIDILDNFLQVTSFDVSVAVVDAAIHPNNEFPVSASAYLCPSSYGHLYGTEEYLVLATQAWDWNPSIRGGSDEKTYLVALKINGVFTEFVSVGTLEGHMLDQYAMDIVGNELRVATTVQQNWGWWGGPMMMEDTVAAAESASAPGSPRVNSQATCEVPTNDTAACDTADSYQSCLELQDKSCVSLVKTFDCPPVYSCVDKVETKCQQPTNDTDACETDESYQSCRTLEDSGCSTIVQTLNCPPIYSCIDDPVTASPTEPLVQESRTENFMVVLEIEPSVNGGSSYTYPTNNGGVVMVEKGRVQIGEPNESITAVRFFDNIAYAVTFERKDPFYVLDMTVPEVLGELKLPGFSNYLHPMNDDNTLLLAIGQNATDDGRVLGLMVTVFDATDPANPKALVSHTFEEDAQTGSSATFDYKAFRYLRSVGKLIIPLEIWWYPQWNPLTGQSVEPPAGAENFVGFVVMDVNTTSISEQFRVSHFSSPYNNNGSGGSSGVCYYCNGGWLPMRSFVYSGDLMTIRDNVVISSSLDTGNEVWRLLLSVEGEAADCCY